MYLRVTEYQLVFPDVNRSCVIDVCIIASHKTVGPQWPTISTISTIRSPNLACYYETLCDMTHLNSAKHYSQILLRPNFIQPCNTTLGGPPANFGYGSRWLTHPQTFGHSPIYLTHPPFDKALGGPPTLRPFGKAFTHQPLDTI